MIEFESEVRARVLANKSNAPLAATTRAFMDASIPSKYSYNFSMLGRPVIQYPQDMVALQELIWKVRPDLIIEAGIAHGGSLVLSASMLVLLDYCDAVESGGSLDPKAAGRRVLGIDIDIRLHNRMAIESHPMAHRIDMIEGSSVAPDVVAQVHDVAKKFERIMVILDSNHTHAHVLAELVAYAPLVSRGSYCVVFDTIIEDLPPGSFEDRPWDVGDNPKTAVREYLARDSGFEIDEEIDSRLLISAGPGGYLKRR